MFGASRNDVRRIHISNWESVWRRDELLNLSWFLEKGMSMYMLYTGYKYAHMSFSWHMYQLEACFWTRSMLPVKIHKLHHVISKLARQFF